jgi:hypothetical protein
MIRSSAVLVCALLLVDVRSATSQAGAAPARATPIAIEHVTVIDVANGRAVGDQTVIVSGSRIASVGPSASARVPAGALRVDARGRYLVPGLWDMHAHRPDKDATLEAFIPLEIANGVTGIRDMFGNDDALAQRASIAAGSLLGPRMVVASPILDGPSPMWPGSIAVTTPEQARRLVDSLKARGYDFIKQYEFMPREIYLALAAEAHRDGIPISGHVPLALSAVEVSNAGQKSLEHAIGLILACSRDADRLRPAYVAIMDTLAPTTSMATLGAHGNLMSRAESEPAHTFDVAKCRDVAATLVKNGTWIVPTLTLFRGLGAPIGGAVRADPRLAYLPADMRHGFDGAPPNAMLDSVRGLMGRIALLMHRAGVGVLVGTDTPNPFVLPGFGVHDEMALLVEAGFTPAEALRAATLEPARYFAATDSLGTVAAGKLADLILLDKNPLTDIRNTTAIRAVFANGRYVDRAAIDSMLAAVQTYVSRAPARPPF